jgi:histidinol dehydrogenase
MISIPVLRGGEPDFEARLTALLASSCEPDPEVSSVVSGVLREIRDRGDAALVEFTNRYDRRNIRAGDLEIPGSRIAAAAEAVAPEVRDALNEAAARIRAFHERQVQESWYFEDDSGVMTGQRVMPLDRVGVYVPGGRAAYPSTVLMNVIPASIAGVGSIIMTVPAPDGELNPLVLAAAQAAGVDRVFGIGGAQAIGALAYGTESIPAVDKIVGPGNRYVAEAKRQVFGVVGIDMIAGPSEVVIVSDGSAEADWIAMDLMAQAEHDEAARAILVCTDADFADRVRARIDALLPGLERVDVIRAALERHGAFLIVDDMEQAALAVNRIAPEHLGLAVSEPEKLLEKIRNAGAIFLGCHAAEVLGDYCAGPNHVLPTARSARFSSPLGVYDFLKRSSVTRCTPAGAAALARIASVLARVEGLTAHARAAELRLRER